MLPKSSARSAYRHVVELISGSLRLRANFEISKLRPNFDSTLYLLPSNVNRPRALSLTHVRGIYGLVPYMNIQNEREHISKVLTDTDIHCIVCYYLFGSRTLVARCTRSVNIQDISRSRALHHPYLICPGRISIARLLSFLDDFLVLDTH